LHLEEVRAFNDTILREISAVNCILYSIATKSTT